MFSACKKEEVEEPYVPMDCIFTDWYATSSSARHAPPECHFEYSDGKLIKTQEFKTGDFGYYYTHYIYDQNQRLVKDSALYEDSNGPPTVSQYLYENDLLSRVNTTYYDINEQNELVLSENSSYFLLEYNNDNQIIRRENFNNNEYESMVEYDYNDKVIYRVFQRVEPKTNFINLSIITYIFDDYVNPNRVLGVYLYDPIVNHHNNVISKITSIYSNSFDDPPTSTNTTQILHEYNSEGLPTRAGITYFNYDCVIRE